MCVQADANAQQIAEDNPELIEIMRELQEKVTSLEKENLKLRERLIALEDIKTSEKLCSFYTGFLNYGTFKALFDYLKNTVATKRNWRGRETESFFWQISKKTWPRLKTDTRRGISYCYDAIESGIVSEGFSPYIDLVYLRHRISSVYIMD